MSETITPVGTYTIYGEHVAEIVRYEETRTRSGQPLIWYYPLTPCCGATGKGLCADTDPTTGESWDGYTGCRKCYAPVADIYGNGWYSEDEWQEALNRRWVVPV